jgi:hypothetical protein
MAKKLEKMLKNAKKRNPNTSGLGLAPLKSERKPKRTYKKRISKVAEATTEQSPAVRSVGVKFKVTNEHWQSSGRIYNYLVDGLDVQVGDTVVVLAPSSGLTLVEVISVSDKPEGTKYIVDKVDLSAHKARIEKIELKAKLMKELVQRKNQIDENKILDIYAKEDKQFASLLSQLRSLE